MHISNKIKLDKNVIHIRNGTNQRYESRFNISSQYWLQISTKHWYFVSRDIQTHVANIS